MRIGVTGLVDIVFAAVGVREESGTSDAGFFAYGAEAFCHDNEFVPWEVIVLDGFADDFFGGAIGVDICGIPLLGFSRVDEGIGCEFTVLMPMS